ncbi:hypothetical protein GCM10022247_36760 [Allokutzneria multivorans]|uniref:Uncharacterized protein n=2 Tax=Allokutzneria multivorans TaxID=1142134 RepID=A0ABP7SFN6_9PSEU
MQSGAGWAPAPCPELREPLRKGTLGMSGLSRRALALLTCCLLICGFTLPAASAQPKGTEGHCPDGNGVTVVVDFQELGGDTLVRCAPGEQASGLTALENAGFEVTGTTRWGKAFICRLNGKPGPDTEPCVNTPPASAYWGYWHAPNGGTWTYSQQGATNRKPPLGSYEGWSFSKDRSASDNPPPRVAPVRPAPKPRFTAQPATRFPKPVQATPGTAEGARWLVGELRDGALPGFNGPDWGLTIDALFVLSATRTDGAALNQVADKVAHNVRGYNSYDLWGQPGVRLADETGKLLAAAVAADTDPTSFGGINLRQEMLELIAGPGPNHGQIQDKGITSDTNTFGQSLAVIGLARSGGVPSEVVDFLIKQQCAVGGFRLSTTLGGTPSISCDEFPNAVLDPDSTAMAIQALLAANTPAATASANKGADWLQRTQRADGSFGGSGPTEASNTNSTGLAAQALAAAGRTEPARKAADYVAQRQLTAANGGAAKAFAGAIAYNDAAFAEAIANGIPEMARDQWRRASAQALLGLAQVPLGKLGALKPTRTAAPPATTVNPSTTTVSTTSASESTTTSAPETTTASETTTSTPPPVVDQPATPLAQTGAEPALPLLAGLVLVTAGLLVTVVARRRSA